MNHFRILFIWLFFLVTISTSVSAGTVPATLVRVTSGSAQGSTNAINLSGIDYQYDDVAGTITQLSAVTHVEFDLNPLPNNTLFTHQFSGVVFDPLAVNISGTAYECIEGQFGSTVGASLCSNSGTGGNFINETTTDYSTIPGARTVGGDDVVFGPQQQLSDYASGFLSYDGTTLIIQTPDYAPGVGGAGLQLEFETQGTTGLDLIDVPVITGLDQATAEATIVAAGLTLGVVTTAIHGTVPAGDVISQNPGGCSICALPGSAVNILVSLGPPLVVTVTERIDSLIDSVRALNLNRGIRRALIRKLRWAKRRLSRELSGADPALILRPFIHHIEALAARGKISKAEANAMLAAANTLTQSCHGFLANIIGTDGDDDITGTPWADIIVGLGGSDRINAGGGDDIVCGGEGDDDLIGGDGADLLFGNAGNDIMEGLAGEDVCDGVLGIDSAAQDCETQLHTDTTVLPVTLTADDGTPLEGALYIPRKDALHFGHRYRQLAMVVSHGAMGSFSSSMPKIMGLQAAPLGFTVLALNRRDWGPTGGGGAVLFEDATLDIGVGVDLLYAMGYRHVFVAGHSQGTNNAAIYPSYSMDPAIAGVGLYGTVADGRDTARTLLFNPNVVTPGYDELVIQAQDLVAAGEGDIVIPWLTGFNEFLFRSPANFLSYWGPDSLSVVKDQIVNLDVPVLMMRADGDEFTPDAMSQEVLASALAAGVDAEYTILDYPFPLTDFGGNAHGFVGVERAMMSTTLNWLNSHIPQSRRYQKRIRVPGQQSNGNFRPLAAAGDFQHASVNGGRFRLDGSRSSDIDGRIVSYAWSQVAGAPLMLDDPATASPSFELPGRPQFAVFILEIVDDKGAIARDYMWMLITR